MVKAAKASLHAKFYNLSTAQNDSGCRQLITPRDIDNTEETKQKTAASNLTAVSLYLRQVKGRWTMRLYTFIQQHLIRVDTAKYDTAKLQAEQ